jgi:cytochrome c biogenesis protein CcmG, thiol:disulfide interchange protein DsbE
VKHRSAIIAGIVGVAVLGLVAIFAFSPDRAERAAASPVVGQLAPELTGTTIDGSEFDIDEHRGEWVVVNFFATWCPPCVEEHPELVAFAEQNVGRAQLVSVAFDDTEIDAVEQFFVDNGGEWPVITAGAGGASLDYGVKKLPESFLVDPGGTVVAKINGGVTSAQLDELIAEAS